MSVSGATLTNPNVSQAEASDPAISAWVTANAGSGKTKVLIDRVARLLIGHGGADPDPSKILCLTFTKAAAANMQNKLFDRLGEWALMEDEALRKALTGLGVTGDINLRTARTLFAQALETPGGLKIQTIHAFCESLLRRFPLEAGLSPHFALVDDAEAMAMHSEALDRVLARAAEDAPLAEAVERVILEGQEFGIRRLVPEIVDKRENFKGDTPDLIAAMQVALGVEIGDSEAKALAAFFAETPVGDVKALAAVFRNGGSTEQGLATKMTPLLQSDLMRDWMQALAVAVFKKDSGEPRKIGRGYPTKAALEIDADLADKIARFQDRLTELQARLSALAAADRSAPMIVFAKAVLEEVDALKGASDGLDFDDLIRRAGALLNNREASAWVRYKLDGGVDHILVDEAQDTSPEQWRVISAIAEEFFAGGGAREVERTLFVVGDEKQSIFSFQGAKPEELDRVRERFRALLSGTGKPLREPQLLHSFRSAPAVLSTVDKVFQQPEAVQGLNALNEPPEHLPFRENAPGRVEFWPPIGRLPDEDQPDWWEPVDRRSQEAPDARLARGIVAQIGEWLSPDSDARVRGRRIRAGDILVLVRTRGSFAENLIRLLKAGGIPVAGKDRMTLNAQLAVRDLLALARFALLPNDDLTLATVLRSPLVGLSEEDLFTLSHGREGRLLWHVLHDRREDAPYADAYALLDDMLDRADFLRPYDFLERALTFHGGRERLLARLGIQAADPIDEVLAQALDFETRGIPTLQGFVARIEESTADIKREMEQGRDEIRIMTVHGSKGLESNIVFMPDICGLPNKSSSDRIYAVEGAPVWSPSAGSAPAPVREIIDAGQARDLEEYRRLLYVGMTRARDRLILCGWHGKDADKEDRVSPDSWAALVRSAFGEGAVEGPTPLHNASDAPVIAQIFETGGDETPEEDGPGEDMLTPLPLDPALALALPAEGSAPVPVAPSRIGAGSADPFAPAPMPSDNEDAEPPLSSAERGTALHLLLEKLADIAPGEREGAARAMLDEAEPDVIAPALAVLKNPDFAWMFGSGSLAEVPVQGPVSALKDHEILGTIDRLVVTDTAVHIVDFKSGRPADGIPLPYRRQLALYRAALGDIFAGREITAHLVWIDANRAEKVEADALDSALAGMLADGSLDLPAMRG